MSGWQGFGMNPGKLLEEDDGIEAALEKSLEVVKLERGSVPPDPATPTKAPRARARAAPKKARLPKATIRRALVVRSLVDEIRALLRSTSPRTFLEAAGYDVLDDSGDILLARRKGASKS